MESITSTKLHQLAQESDQEQESPEPAGETPIHRHFVRLTRSEVRQHFIFFICFVLLVTTGFMIKVPEAVVQIFGEAGQNIFYFRSLVHRIAGVFMILVSLYHLYYLVAKSAGRRWLVDMLPRPRDLTDLFHNIAFYLGMRPDPPAFGRFCYKHKMEYGALIVGTSLMSFTGLILWTESRWSKFLVDIAALIHSMEAILACLAIMIWHLYDVHLRPHKFPLDRSWLTGLIDEETMQEEYPLHYEKIMADPKLQKVFIKDAPAEEKSTHEKSTPIKHAAPTGETF